MASGELEIPTSKGRIIKAMDYGVIPDDGLDDSKALIKAIEAVRYMPGKIILQLPKGL